MALAVLREVKRALSNLNPDKIRETAERPVIVSLVAPTVESLGRMEAFLVPPHLSPGRKAEALRLLHRQSSLRAGAPQSDIAIYDSCLLRPVQAFSFNPEAPEDCVRRVLKQREDLMLPLARKLDPFRKQVTHKVIRAVARENALFCLATALPDLVPGIVSIPWAVGEFGSDAAFVTVNQIRMAFLLAAANDRPLGFREQKSEIASIIASAFGWRTLAREIIAKVPFGGGLIPKAAIAFAATFAVGLSIERLYRMGYGYTRAERQAAYEEAYEHGRQIAGMLLGNLRTRKAG